MGGVCWCGLSSFRKEYIKINTQVALMLFAFASYFSSFLCSSYLIEKKYLESGVSIIGK